MIIFLSPYQLQSRESLYHQIYRDIELGLVKNSLHYTLVMPSIAIFNYLYSIFPYRGLEAAGDLCWCSHNADDAKQFQLLLPFLCFPLFRPGLIPHDILADIFKDQENFLPYPFLPTTSEKIYSKLSLNTYLKIEYKNDFLPNKSSHLCAGRIGLCLSQLLKIKQKLH